MITICYLQHDQGNGSYVQHDQGNGSYGGNRKLQNSTISLTCRQVKPSLVRCLFVQQWRRLRTNTCIVCVSVCLCCSAHTGHWQPEQRRLPCFL